MSKCCIMVGLYCSNNCFFPEVTSYSIRKARVFAQQRHMLLTNPKSKSSFLGERAPIWEKYLRVISKYVEKSAKLKKARVVLVLREMAG